MTGIAPAMSMKVPGIGSQYLFALKDLARQFFGGAKTYKVTLPKDVPSGNWIQTDPKKGWFSILRLYSPLEPFFDKSWRPSEIEEVK